MKRLWILFAVVAILTGCPRRTEVIAYRPVLLSTPTARNIDMGEYTDVKRALMFSPMLMGWQPAMAADVVPGQVLNMEALGQPVQVVTESTELDEEGRLFEPTITYILPTYTGTFGDGASTFTAGWSGPDTFFYEHTILVSQMMNSGTAAEPGPLVPQEWFLYIKAENIQFVAGGYDAEISVFYYAYFTPTPEYSNIGIMSQKVRSRPDWFGVMQMNDWGVTVDYGDPTEADMDTLRDTLVARWNDCGSFWGEGQHLIYWDGVDWSFAMSWDTDIAAIWAAHE